VVRVTVWKLCAIGALTVGTLAPALLAPPASGQALRLRDPAPEIGGGPWINSPPLTIEKLRGRVLLVEFWTYG
jgi:hypothetical protein